jgi:hypothetical protein
MIRLENSLQQSAKEMNSTYQVSDGRPSFHFSLSAQPTRHLAPGIWILELGTILLSG